MTSAKEYWKQKNKRHPKTSNDWHTIGMMQEYALHHATELQSKPNEVKPINDVLLTDNALKSMPLPVTHLKYFENRTKEATCTWKIKDLWNSGQCTLIELHFTAPVHCKIPEQEDYVNNWLKKFDTQSYQEEIVSAMLEPFIYAGVDQVYVDVTWNVGAIENLIQMKWENPERFKAGNGIKVVNSGK